MGLAESLELVINANPASAVQAFDQISSASERSLRSTESNIAKIGSTMAKLGAGGVGVGGLLTTLGSKEEEAAGQLKAAIGQVGQSYSDYADKVEAAEKSQVHFGNTSAETQQALTTLTLSYGDTGKALDEMQLVTDLAARKHVSLADAATMVAKAHGGAARLFKEFGIQVGTNAQGTKDYDGALTQLAQKLQGQASAAADTTSGRFKALRAEVENAVASFGAKFGPAILGVSAVLTGLGSGITVVSSVLGKLRAAHLAAAEAAEAETVVNGLLAASGQAVTESAMGMGEALAAAAGPVGIAIAAVVALGAVTGQFGDTLHTLSSQTLKEFSDSVATNLAAVSNGSDAFAAVVKSVDDALGKDHGLAKAFNDAGITSAKFIDALKRGDTAFFSNINASKADKLAIDQLAGATEDAAKNQILALEATGQLDTAQANSAESANLLANGQTNYLGALQQLVTEGRLAPAVLDAVSESMGNQKKQADELAKELSQIAQGYDDAVKAQEGLLPAEVRAANGPLDVADANRKAADAQQNLNDALKSGDPTKIAQAQRDLTRAQRDVATTAYDAAKASEELDNQQSIAAGHGALSAKTALDDLKSHLEEYTQYLNGPALEAVQQFFNEIAVDSASALEAEKEAQALAEGLLNPGPPSATRTGAQLGAVDQAAPHAIGGALTGIDLVGEYGPEFIRNGYVYPATSDMTRQAMYGAQAGGSSQPLMNVETINIVAPDPESAARATVRALRRRALLSRPR